MARSDDKLDVNRPDSHDRERDGVRGGTMRSSKVGREESLRLHIRGLPFNITSHNLRERMSHFGEVCDAHVPEDRQAGRDLVGRFFNRGYGFVNFKDECVARRLLDEGGFKAWGVGIRVNVATQAGARGEDKGQEAEGVEKRSAAFAELQVSCGL